jgi:hypothetical protein
MFYDKYGTKHISSQNLQAKQEKIMGMHPAKKSDPPKNSLARLAQKKIRTSKYIFGYCSKH